MVAIKTLRPDAPARPDTTDPAQPAGRFSFNIPQRIVAGFAALLLITAALGGFSYLRLRHLREVSATVTQRALPTIMVLGQIRMGVQSNVINTYQHAATDPADTARFDQIEQEMKAGSAAITENYKSLDLLLASDDDKTALGLILAARGRYTGKRGELLKKSRQTTPAEMDRLLRTELIPLYQAYIGAIDALIARKSADADAARRAVEATVSTSSRLILLLVVGALAGGLLVAWLISTRIRRTLSEVAASLGAGSNEVAAAATQVTSASQTLASGASEQAASLEETSASLEEISSMTKRNAESAASATTLANQTRTAAETGAGDVQAMNSAMDAIKASSDNIAKIIKTIDEIAFQTNILALNAAVEAARAGEAGAGFAVVADEVRALAQRSAQAARETAERIEDSISKSENGVAISAKVAASLGEIVTKAREVDTLIAGIATASKEQSQGISEVLKAVSVMDKLTQGNAASAEESAAAAEELNAQAHLMDRAVVELTALVGGLARVAARPNVRPSPRTLPAAPARLPVAEPLVSRN